MRDRILGTLVVFFLLASAGGVLSGCGTCGGPDTRCYTYDDGETLCYDREPCEEEEEE